MDVKQLLAALEAIENGVEMAGVVKSLADEVGKKNREAKNLRDRAKKAESRVIMLNDRFSKVAAFIGLEEGTDDLDSALEALKLKQPQAGDGKGQPSPAIMWLMNQISQLQRELKKLSIEREAFAHTAAHEKAMRIDVLRDLALQQALRNGKAVSPNLLAKILQNSVKQADDSSESFVFVKDNGEELTIDEGVKSFLDANPEFIASGGRPGTSSGEVNFAGTTNRTNIGGILSA